MRARPAPQPASLGSLAALQLNLTYRPHTLHDTRHSSRPLGSARLDGWMDGRMGGRAAPHESDFRIGPRPARPRPGGRASPPVCFIGRLARAATCRECGSGGAAVDQCAAGRPRSNKLPADFARLFRQVEKAWWLALPRNFVTTSAAAASPADQPAGEQTDRDAPLTITTRGVCVEPRSSRAAPQVAVGFGGAAAAARAAEATQ